MSKKKIWEILKTLVGIDQKILECEQKIRASAQAIAEKATDIDKVEELLEKLRGDNVKAKKNIDRKELQAQTLKEEEQKKLAQIKQSTTQKVLDALKREYRQLQHQSSQHETLVLQAWHDADHIEKQLKREQSTYDQKQSMFNEDIKDLENASIQTKKEIISLKENKIETTKELTPGWIQHYERIKNRVQNPIVQSIQSSCGECFYAILPQDIFRMKKGELVSCRNCYRLLYEDQETELDEQKASY